MPQFVMPSAGRIDMHRLYQQSPDKFFNWIGVSLAFNDLSSFTQGYVECLFFTIDDDLRDATFSELAPAALASIIADCAAFQLEAAPLLALAYGAQWNGAAKYGEYCETQAGHDFAFTRNGDGVGFWDRDLPGSLGDDLSSAARGYGARALYRGDDELIYYCEG